MTSRDEQIERDTNERRILGLKPWEIPPSRVAPDSKNPWPIGSGAHGEWEKARALRIQIDERRKLRAGAATKPEGEKS